MPYPFVKSSEFFDLFFDADFAVMRSGIANWIIAWRPVREPAGSVAVLFSGTAVRACAHAVSAHLIDRIGSPGAGEELVELLPATYLHVWHNSIF
jgi:hypothetical protein